MSDAPKSLSSGCSFDSSSLYQGVCVGLDLEPLENTLDAILLRDDQRFFVVVAGESHTKGKTDLAHVLHGEAVLEGFLELLRHFQVPSSDEGVTDVETGDCEGTVAAVCVNATV